MQEMWLELSKKNIAVEKYENKENERGREIQYYDRIIDLESYISFLYVKLRKVATVVQNELKKRRELAV